MRGVSRVMAAKSSAFPYAIQSRISGKTHTNLKRFEVQTQHTLSELVRYRLDGTTIFSLPSEWITGALTPAPHQLRTQRPRLLLASNQIIAHLNEFNRLVLQPQPDPWAGVLLYDLLRHSGQELKALTLLVGSLVP